MAITIEKDETTGKFTYRFFDANNEIIEFYYFFEFKEYLKKMANKYSLYYGFRSLKDNDYTIFVREHKLTPETRTLTGLEKIELNDIDITASTLLAQKKIKIKLDKNTHITFNEFDRKNNILKIKMTNLNNEIIIFTDIINIYELKSRLSENTKITETYNGEIIFLSKEQYKVYKIINLEDILEIKNYNLDVISEKSSTQLSENLDDFFQQEIPVTFRSNEKLPTIIINNELPIESELGWIDPIENPKLIPQHSAEDQLRLDESDYEHNIIFQLQDDPENINNVSARMIGKHPKDTTLILFDIINNQYEVVYGDINRAVKGKTRWFIAGHGRFKKDEPTLFAHLSPQQLVDGLANIKIKLTSLQSPDKIVLGGCKLAAGNIHENFARNSIPLFYQKGFDVPIVAYSETVYTEIDGSKYMHSRLDTRTDEFKKVYSWDKINQQILINNEPEILLLIDKLKNNEIDYDTFIRNNNSILSLYFKNEYNELDQDLIKKVIYSKNGYELFQEITTSQTPRIEGGFYQEIVNKLKTEGIDKVPLCRIIDNEYIEKNPDLKNKNITGDIDIIFRIKDSESIRNNVEKLALKNPNNTIIFQVDVVNHKLYTEYGNLDQLEAAQKQSWKIVDFIDREESLSGVYALLLSNGLYLAKSRYNLPPPKNIEIINTNQYRKTYYLNESLTLANELLKNLRAKDIHSNLYLDSYNNPDDIIINNQFINKTKFHYNTEENITYINGEHPAKYIITDIVKNKLPLDDFELFDYHYLMPYLSNSSGTLDPVKSLLIINDPFINIDVNTYFTDKIYLQPNAIEKWNDIFNQSKQTTLKQRAIDTLDLLNAIDKNPNIIINLGRYATELLADLFPQDNGYHIGNILNLITQPKDFTYLQGKINALVSLEFPENFNQLSLAEALKQSQKRHDIILTNLLSMQDIAQNTEISTRINFVNHGFYFADNSIKNKKLKDTLGQIYAYCKSSLKPDEKFDFIKMINYGVSLNSKKQTTKLSADEELYLSFYQEMVFNLMKELLAIQEISIESSIKNSSFRQWLKKAKPNAYKIQTSKGDFTLIFKKTKENYQYSIFDADGLEASYIDENQDKVLHEFTEHIIKYLNNKNEVEQVDSRPYSEENEQPLVKTDYQIDVEVLGENKLIQQSIHEKITNLIIPQQIPSGILNISEISIPLATLSRLGATIDDIPLNQRHLANPECYKNIRFNAETLSSRLTFVEGSDEDIILIRALKQMMMNKENKEIIHPQSDLINYSNLLQQLDYIDHYIDTQKDDIDIKLWQKLQYIGLKSPSYIELMHRTGQALNLAGFITLLTSTYGMMQQLDDPTLIPAARDDIHKNLGIAWASGMINLSDIAQPALLKIAYQQTHSFKVAGTLAGHVTIGLILAGIGFDIYNAYESFSKLATEKNSAIRQDLIVNGNLSLAGIGVAITSIFGLITGSAAAGPFGIISGAALMFGGMIYNAVRAINNIKQQITLTANEEFTTGARIALGLPPVISVQNKLRKKNIELTMEGAAWNYDRQFYIHSILPNGFDSHVYTEEHIFSEGEDAYYLIDDEGNYFGGTLEIPGYERFLLSLGLINSTEVMNFYSKINARLFSKQEAEYFLQRNDLLDPSGNIYHDSTKKMADIYKIQKAELKIYSTEHRRSSDEIIILNPNYKNNNNELLDSLLLRGKNNIATISTVGSKDIKFYTLNKFGLDEKIKKVHFNQFSFEEINNIDKIKSVLNTQRIQSGISFNTESGHDIIIGNQHQENSFQIYNGAKFFAGGDKKDLFYYLSHDRLSYQLKDRHSYSVNALPKKHFDGQGGEDSFILASIIDGIITEIDLNKGEIRHKTNNSSYVIATIENIENVIGYAQGSEIIYGDDKNNYLDSSGGKTELYGHGGEDKLFLDQGYANGGDGKDYYFIRSYKWSHYTNGLLIKTRKYSEQKKEFTNEINYNDKFNFQNGYSYNCHIVIDEKNQDYSVVELDYSLEHITTAKIDNNDLHLTISIPSYHITKNISSTEVYNDSTQTIVLKNVYRNSIDNQNKITHHQYTIKTKDGFLLSSNLKNQLKNSSPPKLLFNIQYINNQDKYQKSFHEKEFPEASITTDIYASVKNKTLEFISMGKPNNSLTSIVFKRKYSAPSWGEFVYASSADKFSFTGDEGDNSVSSIGSNSYIYASKGSDYYHINETDKQTEKDNSHKIIFDFSNLKYPNGYVGHNNNFDSNDKIILILENDDANQLIMNKNTLYFGSNNNNKKSPIRFINFQQDIVDTIFIHDKNNNIFAVNLTSQGGSIKWLNTPSFTTNANDVIRITKGYPISNEVIDGQAGDDIIIDISGEGHLINGGYGKDILTFASGHNAIYGGKDNDKLFGGRDDDLLIAAYGDDQLLGGKGNDRYLIDGDTIGHITIDDTLGQNSLYLMNFHNTHTNVNSHHKIYTAFNGGTVSVIYRTQDTNENINHIYIDNRLKKRLENRLSRQTAAHSNNLFDRLIQNMANARNSYDTHHSELQSAQHKPSWSAIAYFEQLIH
nr:C80 family cysteine peptidase [uncultured Moellerella sp.]